MSHCETCTCDRRAPVQGGDFYKPGKPAKGPGSVTWEEHLKAWWKCALAYGTGQTAERVAERGGFGYGEMTQLLGHEPRTWRPCVAAPAKETR